MFTCRACVSRCIRAIAADAPKQHRLLAGNPLLLTPPTTPARRHASHLVPRTQREEGMVQGKQPVEGDGDLKGAERGPQTESGIPERQLRLELKYLEDRFKLAEHVHYTLRCDKPDKALDLCRLASKHQDVVVSWNHCINWALKKGKVDHALKIYNEMKKRAQFPDTYTYSILLAGLAIPPAPGQLVKASNLTKALSIYYSMSGPTSRVKPSIIHTNNVLKVCKDAGDMDALWSVVAKLSDQGANAPNAITYSILLNAIQTNAFGQDVENVPMELIAEHRAKAVHESRAVWRDVIKKWRNGQIQVDENLVISMSSSLKLSKNIQDWDDILNLVQQTMNIPRQLAALGSPDRHIEHVPRENQIDFRQADPFNAEDDDGYSDTPTANAFKPVSGLVGLEDKQHPLVFVRPTQRILSHLIDASWLLRSPKTAQAYWDLLTAPDGPYAVQPDGNTYRTYLKLLGRMRASRKAVDLLRQMAEAKVEPNKATFRIAMSICERDIKNKKNVLANARAMIDVMESTLPEPDVPTLAKYLKLVLASEDGKEIVFTIDRLDSIVHNLRGRISYGSVQTNKSAIQHMFEIEETLVFLRSLIGIMDVVLHRELVPQDQRTHWMGRRKQLTSFVASARENSKANKARWEQETGRKMPDFNHMNPKKGLTMTEDESALREFKHRQRVEKAERIDKAARIEMARRAYGLGNKLRGERIRNWMQEWRRTHMRLGAIAMNMWRQEVQNEVKRGLGRFKKRSIVRPANKYLPVVPKASRDSERKSRYTIKSVAFPSNARAIERTRRERLVMQAARRAVKSRDPVRAKRLGRVTSGAAFTAPTEGKHAKLWADSQGTRVFGGPGAVTKRLALEDWGAVAKRPVLEVQGAVTKRLNLQSQHVRYKRPDVSPNVLLLSTWMDKRRGMLRSHAREGKSIETTTTDGKPTWQAVPNVGDEQQRSSSPPEVEQTKTASDKSKPDRGRKCWRKHSEKKHTVAFGDSASDLYINES